MGQRTICKNAQGNSIEAIAFPSKQVVSFGTPSWKGMKERRTGGPGWGAYGPGIDQGDHCVLKQKFHPLFFQNTSLLNLISVLNNIKSGLSKLCNK